MSLASKTCVPCRGGVPPLKGKELADIHHQVPEWAHWTVVNEHHVTRTFQFPDFRQALAFVNRVGALAEEQGPHPASRYPAGLGQSPSYPVDP